MWNDNLEVRVEELGLSILLRCDRAHLFPRELQRRFSHQVGGNPQAVLQRLQSRADTERWRYWLVGLAACVAIFTLLALGAMSGFGGVRLFWLDLVSGLAGVVAACLTIWLTRYPATAEDCQELQWARLFADDFEQLVTQLGLSVGELNDDQPMLKPLTARATAHLAYLAWQLAEAKSLPEGPGFEVVGRAAGDLFESWHNRFKRLGLIRGSSSLWLQYLLGNDWRAKAAQASTEEGARRANLGKQLSAYATLLLTPGESAVPPPTNIWPPEVWDNDPRLQQLVGGLRGYLEPVIKGEASMAGPEIVPLSGGGSLNS